MELIDGKKLAQNREVSLKRKSAQLKVKPKVITIVIGDDPASLLYTKMKKQKARDLGIDFEPKQFNIHTAYLRVIEFIRDLNNDESVNGIMVQLPIPDEFLKGHNWKEVISEIKTEKDVDGLKYPDSKFLPATAVAVLSIFDDEDIKVKGKNVVVLGRSTIVGKPVAEELTKRGANVNVVHSQTPNPKEVVSGGDIVISAVGKPYLVKKDWIKSGAVVIDVGTAPFKGKIVGDIEPSAYAKASKITPVPGGVGPMTVISLMENVIKSVS